MKPEQITAWALDEASAEEREQLEAALREDPQTQQAAEATKDFCHFLLAELRDDSLTLTEEQREHLKAMPAGGGALARQAPPKAGGFQGNAGASADPSLRRRRAGDGPPYLPARTQTWRTGNVLRLAIAACLAVGGFWLWQQVESRRPGLAAGPQVPTEPEFKVKPAAAPARAASDMALLADNVAKAAVVEGAFGQMRGANGGMPGSLPGLPSLSGIPGGPLPSVAVSPGDTASSSKVGLNGHAGTLSVGDVATLKKIQDQNAYGVQFAWSNGHGGGDSQTMDLGGTGSLTRGWAEYRMPGMLDGYERSPLITAGNRSSSTPVGGSLGAMAPVNPATSLDSLGVTLGAGYDSKVTFGNEGPLQMATGGVVGLGNTGSPLTVAGARVLPLDGGMVDFGGFSDVASSLLTTAAISGSGTSASSSTATTFAGAYNDLGGAPTSKPADSSATENVHKGLLIANSSVELGNYDAAVSQYQNVLRADPYNQAARRGMEETEKKRQQYFQSAYDHTRAKMLSQVDEAWEDKLPMLASTDSRYFGNTSVPGKPEPLLGGLVMKEQVSSAESYQRIVENELKDVAREPLSTFSIDVDTAAYTNMRRFLNQGSLPPPDAVRIEELINYFPAAEEGPAPDAKAPFGVRVEMAPCPWEPEHRLARIAIKGRELGNERKASNLVFLVDVSGSMSDANKLPLVQQSLRMLTEQLGEGDRVTLVVYAGSSGLVLPPTNGEKKSEIMDAIDKLKAGGSTHGSAGIQLAYEQAVAGFIKDGVNRVILCTDGDFNVGVNSPEELEKLITKKAKSGVFLSVLGFGSGNLKDHTMETLADKGNGNYAYIDSLGEARKVLVEQMGSTLVTIAKDVKIQVEFNPAAVRSYRLIGYENRLMAKEDFNDDTKDAGEIGAGHSVVALYEIVPANLPPGAEPRPVVDNLRYQTQAPAVVAPAHLAEAAKTGEVMTVKLRYKEPDSSLSKLIEVPAKDEGRTLTASSEEFKFSAAVAGFGLLLRDSQYKGALGWETVRKLALDGKGADKLGYRGEFLQLIDKARGLKGTRE